MRHWRTISEEERAALKAEAEQRARAGERFPAIARALDVGVATIHRWAEEGGWRGCDLAAEDWAQRMEDMASDPPDGQNGEGCQFGEAAPVSRRGRTAPAPMLAPIAVDVGALSRLEEPGMAVRLAAVLAMDAQMRGDLDTAERHARLGERLARLAHNIPYATRESTLEEIRAELDKILPRGPERREAREAAIDAQAGDDTSSDEGYVGKL